ncbi:redoxin domain-containing protein [Halobacillus sp. A1]|uniref:redoxin domain-containing protein n=1 Tax=Halobacillus sp. A1 TaxID=2880262 RepID=UPI0020A6B259|nr:redoxin domain-containing protein [Halobacillus sp. A1]MCP3030103.1 redoxin domain-containing protein [Halobacillus sp. A1]
MKKWVVVLFVTALFGWAVYDLTEPEEETGDKEGEKAQMVAEGPATDDPETGLDKGQLAPDFSLERLNGEETKLSDLRGKKVMLNFWATWCPPCRAEMPDMEKFHQNEDVEILAVNLTETESSVGDVEEFADEFGLSFQILKDKNSEVSTIYEVNPVPTSVFIDEEGKIQSVMLGAMNYDMMLQRLEEL